MREARRAHQASEFVFNILDESDTLADSVRHGCVPHWQSLKGSQDCYGRCTQSHVCHSSKWSYTSWCGDSLSTWRDGATLIGQHLLSSWLYGTEGGGVRPCLLLACCRDYGLSNSRRNRRFRIEKNRPPWTRESGVRLAATGERLQGPATKTKNHL